jgi:hypothetical protein
MKISDLLKFIAIAVSVVIIFISCEDKESSINDNYKINSLSTDGSATETTKLIIIVNDDNFTLTAEDIKINANFPVIKGVLTKTGAMTYEFLITPGNTGTIRVGLDPYRGFTEWDAKTANVYADWCFSGTSELTITGKNKKEDPLVIGGKISGLNITAIGDMAFYNKELKDVTIPYNIKVIGENAFERNQLKEIIIPPDVHNIANYAFAFNQLTDIIFLGDIISIGYAAFAYNELSDFTIPETVTNIGSLAFAYNTLTDITIHEGVKSIGESAFAYNLLNKVDIPDGVISIGASAFANNKLTEIDIPNSVNTIGSNAFINNQLINVTISNNELYNYIGASAFANNNLSAVIIPDNVRNIDTHAFLSNPLISIKIGKNVTLGTSAFGNDFESFYSSKNKAAGTYTRPDADSNTWSFTP